MSGKYRLERGIGVEAESSKPLNDLQSSTFLLKRLGSNQQYYFSCKSFAFKSVSWYNEKCAVFLSIYLVPLLVNMAGNSHFLELRVQLTCSFQSTHSKIGINTESDISERKKIYTLHKHLMKQCSNSMKKSLDKVFFWLN